MSNYEVTGEMFDRVIDSLEHKIKVLQNEIVFIKGNMEFQEDTISSMKSSMKKFTEKMEDIDMHIETAKKLLNIYLILNPQRHDLGTAIKVVLAELEGKGDTKCE